MHDYGPLNTEHIYTHAMKKLLTLLSLLVVAGPLAAQTAAPTLIPFQARLTDQNGVAYTNNQYTIVFQLYDQAVGGTLLWSERHEKVGVLNGMVNVFLGSIATLTNVSFSSTRYLGITVDGDNNPNTADPEMVPRQMIIPAFWAQNSANSQKLAGYAWSDLLGNSNPALGIPGSRLQAASITSAQIASSAVGSNQLALNAITAAHVPRPIVVTNGVAAPAGARAVSASCGNFSTLTTLSYVAVNNFSLTVTTTGYPVEVSFASDSGSAAGSPSGFTGIRTSDAFIPVILRRNGTIVGNQQPFIRASSEVFFPPGAFRFLDFPPAGTHTYLIQVRGDGSANFTVKADNMVMIVREF